jgi:hypothetical protein
MDSYPAPAPVEFQTVLRLVVADGIDEAEMERIAEGSLGVLQDEAGGLALGPVASADLDQRTVELEMTIEAPSDAELHQKMSLILAALERGVPLRLRESTALRSQDRDLVCA